MLPFRPFTLDHMLPLFLGWWLALATNSCVPAEPTLPKHEFRATWVATAFNIDWPTGSSLSPAEQRAEFLALLDQQQAMGMNAVIVQVRGSGDAIYPSELAPWSAYLTGTQGQPPVPYYDPLAFMIEACHARNLEFHAWLNPFRAISHVRFSSVSDQHAARIHPEWTFTYENGSYFDPGLPAVHEHLLAVVMELVNQYDIDGLHFDDYFYPYRKNGQEVPDSQTFDQHRRHRMDRPAWRRDNIDRFVERVSDSLRQAKPWVKFGISPMGIWRNQREDPLGSDSHVDQTAYDALHADVRKWLQMGWIDYVAPQLYWSTEHPRASYDKLLNWWSANAAGRHLYVGHAIFKLKTDKHTYWRNPSQLPEQLALNLHHPQVRGSIFYSANAFRDNPHHVRDWLHDERFRWPALIPAMPWKDSVPAQAPDSLWIEADNTHLRLRWSHAPLAADSQNAAYYVVYRFRSDQPQNLADPTHILAIQRDTTLTDARTAPGLSYLYLVTACDRLHNESLTAAAALWQPEPPLADQAPRPETTPVVNTREVPSIQPTTVDKGPNEDPPQP
jgi:uncharacterized lipoprotein YddW (UPF0748 family)